MNDQELMVRAAWMYYHSDMTHAEIARKLHLNRVKVTRLLKRAREQGVVEIRVTQPMPPDLELSRQIETHFGIQQAIVVTAGTPGALGQAAAELLAYMLKPGLTIGFGWSSTVSQIAPHIAIPKPVKNLTVVDLVGSMLGKANPYSVSGRVADALGATLLPLAVPVMVSTPEARETLLTEPGIRDVLDVARTSDIAFVGVGEVGATNTLVEIGYLPPKQMAKLEQNGVVGEMLMRFFSAEGGSVPLDFDERLIGISWNDLRKIPNVVLVAAGVHKQQALLGALRSDIPNILITDIETAQSLLSSKF